MKKPKEEAVVPRTLLLSMVDGKDQKITIPAGSRLTFGPTVPYAPKGGYHSEERGWSLRVYDGPGPNTLAAVFSGVVAFRDINMPVYKLVIRESGQSLWKSDEQGYKTETEVKREESFIEATKLLKG